MSGARASGWLRVTAAGRDLLLPIAAVREIAALPHVTPVPGLPPWVLGVANHRGRIVPVIDVGAWFRTRFASRGDEPCLVLVEVPSDAAHRAPRGLVVEAVREVVVTDLAGPGEPLDLDRLAIACR
jgi:chemotaxis signal transduction protein